MWTVFCRNRATFERTWALDEKACENRFLTKLALWLCKAPATLMNVDVYKGSLAPGKYADFVVWDPSGSTLCTYDTIRSANKDNCLYLNQIMECEVTHTYLRGELVFRNGSLVARRGKILLPNEKGRVSSNPAPASAEATPQSS